METFRISRVENLKSNGCRPFAAICAALAIFLAAGRPVFGWGSRVHEHINRRAAAILPPEMKNFKSCAGYLASRGSLPDEWKGFLTGEEYRHYIDMDFYGAPPFAAVAGRPLAEAIEKYGEDDVVSNGVVPWTISEHCEMLALFLKSTATFDYAMLCAAVLGHYVADAHQPLHTTENYDGHYSGNGGVHLRYELEAADSFFDDAAPPPAARRADGKARYIDDTLAFAFDFVIDAHAGIPAILDADTAAGGNPSALWSSTSEMTSAQIEKAASNLASLWYTAWKNAGSPSETVKFKNTAAIYSDKDYRKMLGLKNNLKTSGKNLPAAAR